MGKKIVTFCIFLFGIFHCDKTYSLDAELVRSLNQEFLVYDNQHKSLLPVIDKSKYTNTLYLKILASDIANHKLKIQSKSAFYLYLNSKIVFQAPKGIYWINLRDFAPAQFNNDHIFLSIYALNAINSVNVDLYRNTHLTFQNSSAKNIALTQESEYFKINSFKKNKYMIGVIMSILTFIILKVLVPKIYQRIFNVQIDMSSLLNRSSSKLTYFQNESIFIFMFISILVGIYMFVFLDKDTYVSGFKILNSTYQANLFIYGLLGTFVLFFSKYLVYTLLSSVFGVESFSKILINEFSKTIFQALLFIYPVYFIIFSPYYQFDNNAMLKFVYPIVLVLSIFILKELYFFYHLFNSKKFYIIAYICICDLFPTCVFLKILSQSEFI